MFTDASVVNTMHTSGGVTNTPKFVKNVEIRASVTWLQQRNQNQATVRVHNMDVAGTTKQVNEIPSVMDAQIVKMTHVSLFSVNDSVVTVRAKEAWLNL